MAWSYTQVFFSFAEKQNSCFGSRVLSNNSTWGVSSMNKNVLFSIVLFVLFLFISACSSTTDPEPTVETVAQIPVLASGQTASFTLIQTTDVHHHVVGSGPSAKYGAATGDTTLGGYSRIARTIAQIKATKAASGIPTVLVDSGDFFMGTVYDMSLGASPAALAFFESMDYDAITLGNHELDYGPTPLAQFFSLAIGNYPGVSKFNVPVVASNMVMDGVSGTGDDGLEALKAASVIQDSLILTLANGLKVGILGFLGENAELDAPLASPVTFVNDMSDVDQIAAIQAKVTALKTAGAHVVIALSHSGITDPNGTPGGDDIALADAVTGIDIIASGHDHEMTDDVVTENGTRIICAGHYGENVAQLDVTVTVGTGVTTATLTNNTIDSSLVQYGPIQVYLVGALDSGINEALVENGLPEVNDIVAGTNSNNMDMPETVGESGIGNLVADSLRYTLGGAEGNPSMGIVANGVIRNGYTYGQEISFADLYNTLPLGMSPDEDNQNIPGYPLLMVYIDATSIVSLCNLASLTIAANNDAFMTALLNSGVPAYVQKYYLLQNLKADYYLNMSGVQYTYAADYSVAAGSIALYGSTDFSCQSTAAIPLAGIGANYIPCVFDLYMGMMFLDPTMQGLLTAAGLDINPMVMGGSGLEALSLSNILTARLDRDDETAGIQEVKEWMALLQYVTNPTASAGLNSLIPDSSYGTTALETGSASRVNAP